MQQQVKTLTLRGSRSWVEEVILSAPSEHSVQEAATEDWQTVDGDAGKHRETFMLWNSACERPTGTCKQRGVAVLSCSEPYS